MVVEHVMHAEGQRSFMHTGRAATQLCYGHSLYILCLTNASLSCRLSAVRIVEKASRLCKS